MSRVRRRQHSHVERNLCRAAHAAQALLFDHAQQLGLQLGLHLGQLVEQQRAAVGGLEASFLAPVGAGERAALMAEQLAFHQRLWNRRAIDRHVSRVAARRQLVNGARDQLLAGAAFAGNHDRRGRLRQPLDRGDHFAHRRRFSEQRSELADLGQPPPQIRVLLANANVAGKVLQNLLHMRRINGLAHVVDSAELERRDRVGNFALPRNHDGRQVDPHLADIVQQLEPALARHLEIRKKYVRIEAADELQRSHAVLGNLATKPPRRQQLAPFVVRVDVVFRDQNSNFVGHGFEQK